MARVARSRHHGGMHPTSTDASRRIAFPRERKLVLDTLRLGRGKPMMHGLIELDVTRARAALRERQARGAPLSFTAFVLACIGRAVALHPEVHARRDWLGRLVIFDEVDAATIIEVAIDDRRFPLAHVVRAIDRRSPEAIHDEIRAVQEGGARTLSRGTRRATRALSALPGFVRRLLYRLLLASPRRAKRRVGTLLVTAVGMFGSGTAGWGLSAPGLHDLAIIVGGITERPKAIDEAETPAAPREVLCLTVSANHALIDGAPLARFAAELARLVERADGLVTPSAPTTTRAAG